MKKENDEAIKKKRDRNKSTVILILTVIISIFILYIIQWLITGEALTFEELVSNVSGNLIGVLAAFLLFDVINERLTKDSYAEEVSEQITKTLMGNDKIMDAFTTEDKKNFLAATVKSVVEDRRLADMAKNAAIKQVSSLIPNPDRPYSIRDSFDYRFTVGNGLDERFSLFHDRHKDMLNDDYVTVDEQFSFDISFVGGITESYQSPEKELYLSFSFDKRNLDIGLLKNSRKTAEEEKACKAIFSESLDLSMEDAKKVINMPEDELMDFIDCFGITLRVDKKESTISHVWASEEGIIVSFFFEEYDAEALSHSVRIYFNMPKLIGTLLEVAIVDPSKGPHIMVDYRNSGLDVDMYSFLNKSNESNYLGADQKNSECYDVEISDWMFPRSGMVFTMGRKKN